MDTGSEWEVGEPSLNSSQGCYIYVRANKLGEGLNQSLLSTYGLNIMIDCIVV